MSHTSRKVDPPLGFWAPIVAAKATTIMIVVRRVRSRKFLVSKVDPLLTIVAANATTIMIVVARVRSRELVGSKVIPLVSSWIPIVAAAGLEIQL